MRKRSFTRRVPRSRTCGWPSESFSWNATRIRRWSTQALGLSKTAVVVTASSRLASMLQDWYRRVCNATTPSSLWLARRRYIPARVRSKAQPSSAPTLLMSLVGSS